ncbi:MAG: aldehyde dehydrogenase family protein [bacterium]|nr:aldehyde dehydrogenase family protein [bacterium]MDE0601523.1 aldehyde dehydrogenase family protein [bacterium]
MGERLAVRKTYKLYIDGGFPRSESGRTFPVVSDDGSEVVHISRASRKDLRMAVRAARAALAGWKGRSGYNRGQVLYRIAEMVEDRAATFAAQLELGGSSAEDARGEVGEAIDLLIWYAGWCDKYMQVVGNMNPVAGPFFNISVPEPVGVVGVIAPSAPVLRGLVAGLAPVVSSGNTAVVVASPAQPMIAITLAEALATADVPAGVVNILTGFPEELAPWLAGHMDVNGVDFSGVHPEGISDLEEAASHNLKRTGRWEGSDANLYRISAFTEIKTVWHPKGR